MSIILASGSPRRRELLTMLGVRDLKIIPPVNQEASVRGKTPGDAVSALSLAKAEEVSKLCDISDIIIAADTVVSVEGEILGKPLDAAHAALMLNQLSGRAHNVFTGVTVMRGDEHFTEYERTLVHFRKLNQEEIENYIKTGEPMDKAGSYGAQGIGSLFVESIEGDFFNVMGLPLCRLSIMLKKLGVSLI